jgi:hypothetical protein
MFVIVTYGWFFYQHNFIASLAVSQLERMDYGTPGSCRIYTVWYILKKFRKIDPQAGPLRSRACDKIILTNNTHDYNLVVLFAVVYRIQPNEVNT